VAQRQNLAQSHAGVGEDADHRLVGSGRLGEGVQVTDFVGDRVLGHRREVAEDADGAGRLASDAGITPKTLSLIERGEANPTWGTVRGIAEALNVSMTDPAKLADKFLAVEK
jgi:transcriptional regulator with XRE-family HTH domain